MSIEAELQSKLKEALRAKDSKTANVIRMVKSRVTERRTAKGFDGEVDDKLHLAVIAAYAKSLSKARVEFEVAGERGAESIAELNFELAFLKQYLPEQMDEAQVREAVKIAIEELGASDVKMAGRVVGAVMKKHKGVAPAPLVKKIAEALLGS